MLTTVNQASKRQLKQDFCNIVAGFMHSSTSAFLLSIVISNVYPTLECELRQLFGDVEFSYQKCDGLHLIRCKGYTIVFARITAYTPYEFMTLAIERAESYNVLVSHLVNGYTRVALVGSTRWET